MRSKRSSRWGAGLAVVGLGFTVVAGGCAFLLDTDELQEGSGGVGDAGATGGTGGTGGTSAAGSAGSAGSAGAAGTAGAAGAGGAVPRTCTDADGFLRCMESPVDDPCTKDWCESGVCQRKTHDGQALFAETQAISVKTNQWEIGPVRLATDDTNFYMGFVFRPNETDDTKVEVRRHQADAGLSATVRTLDEVFPGFVFRSSPALSLDAKISADSKLRIAVVATDTEPQSGMHRVELKASDLTAISGPPNRVDGGSGYLLYPMQVSPYFLTSALGEAIIWPFEGIRTMEWTGTPPVNQYEMASAKVLDLAPLSGSTLHKYGAVVAAEIDNTEKLVLWSRAGTNFDGEFVNAEGERLGISTARVEMMSPTENVSTVAWAQKDSSGRARLKLGTASCSTQKCEAQTYTGPSIADVEAVRPAVTVRKEGTSSTLRRVALVYAGHAASSASFATSALMLSIVQLDLADPNRQTAFENLPYNPPVSLLTTPDYEAPIDPLESPFRSTAVAVTPNGKIMVAWVYQKPGELASLWYQRFRMDPCPSP